MAAKPASARGRQEKGPARGRAPTPEEKILRIGVIHNGRIIEERLVPAGNPVTVGEHPKCTVVVPQGDASPGKRFPLFEPKGGRYSLNFTTKMHGKVSVGDKIETLATLGKKGRARKRGTHYNLQLTQRNRGKVYVGDYTVLFQFVAPPPQPLRRRNADFRAWRWEDVDWVFLAIMLLSALLHTAGVIWIESQPPAKQLRLEDFPDRFVKLMLPPDPPPPEVAETTDEGDGPDAGDDEPVTAEPGPDADADAGEEEPEEVESAEDRQARLEDEVSSTGLLALIGTANTDSGGAVADLLSDSGSLSDDVGSALASSSGVAVARRDADQSGLRGGGGGDEAAGAGELGGAGGGPGGDVVAAQVEITGKVGTGNADIVASSPEDTSSVQRTMKRYTGRVKQCYERELKGNPDLAGKVTVSFDIDTSGNVSGVQVPANTTGNSALGDCIRKVVERIRFVPPPEDDMEVAGYPFILAKQ